MTTQKYYNEKPSQIGNIGEDIPQAARHRNDTYETDEQKQNKQVKRTTNKALKKLRQEYEDKFSEALSESTEAAKATLVEYEIKRTTIQTPEFSSLNQESWTVSSLRSFVENFEGDSSAKSSLIKKANTLFRRIHKIKYHIRPINLSTYFKPKTTFKEGNGHLVKWKTTSTAFDLESIKQKVSAIQFGNSLTDNERIYVCENLINSVELLGKYFPGIDFASLGFSYGARGKKGSVAFYCPNFKVLSFNRGIDGAFIHEMGHAIDYQLNEVSNSMPWSVVSRYRNMLIERKMINISYYCNKKEIFARMFEVYCRNTMPELTEFMQFTFNADVMPDLFQDEEAFSWFFNVIKNLTVSEVVNEKRNVA